jgi:hypothetical protein
VSENDQEIKIKDRTGEVRRRNFPSPRTGEVRRRNITNERKATAGRSAWNEERSSDVAIATKRSHRRVKEFVEEENTWFHEISSKKKLTAHEVTSTQVKKKGGPAGAEVFDGE